MISSVRTASIQTKLPESPLQLICKIYISRRGCTAQYYLHWPRAYCMEYPRKIVLGIRLFHLFARRVVETPASLFEHFKCSTQTVLFCKCVLPGTMNKGLPDSKSDKGIVCSWDLCIGGDDIAAEIAGYPTSDCSGLQANDWLWSLDSFERRWILFRATS